MKTHEYHESTIEITVRNNTVLHSFLRHIAKGKTGEDAFHDALDDREFISIPEIDSDRKLGNETQNLAAQVGETGIWLHHIESFHHKSFDESRVTEEIDTATQTTKFTLRELSIDESFVAMAEHLTDVQKQTVVIRVFNKDGSLEASYGTPVLR